MTETEAPKSKIVIKVIPKGDLVSTARTQISASVPLFPKTIEQGQGNTYISFDVGIVNLAYCILTGDAEIIDWNIITLATGDSKLLCSCKRKATYVSEGIGYCGVHGRNKGYPRNLTTENITEYELKCNLFRALDANPIFLRPSHILIELQPLLASEKIKGVGHALFDYYVLRGVIDGRCEYKELRFIDAKNKLTVYTGPPLSCPLKTQYLRNKWYGKAYCKWMLRDSTKELEYFDTFKKRDDLADCYLQGIWYIKYGQHGTKAPKENHGLAQAESNTLKYKKIRARAPGKGKKCTMANLKYHMGKGRDPIEYKDTIEFFFGTMDYFKEHVL